MAVSSPLLFLVTSSGISGSNYGDKFRIKVPDGIIVVISVPDIPVGNGKGQSALPTPNENGIYLFDDLNTFELVCNSSACDWMIKSQKRSIFRQDSPITMYLLPKMAEDLCTDCGKNQIT